MSKLVRSLLLASSAIASSLVITACCATSPVVTEPPPAPRDTDGDGIADSEDTCPEVAGSAQFGGCVDTDGDGFPDNTDQCPNEPGVTDHRGCPPPPPPDQDADGVIDPEDQCPTVVGPAETKGCPDKDGDSVLDADDACPDQAGVVEEKGCLPKAAQRFAGAIKGITFDAGKATIKKASNKTLDDAAKVLEQYPLLRLEVGGHTDDQGPDDTNMTLSQQRADAVKAYLVGKGIADNRVAAVGYGETAPVVPNTNNANRAKNRRIEFKILGVNSNRRPIP